MNVMIEFGYLPEGFHGFARQPDRRTVEGEIVRVLERTGAVDGGYFTAASRTDKGVGAFRNYIVFSTHVEIPEVVRRLNSMVEGAFFYGGCRVREDFNPRHALYRQYVYYLDPGDIGDAGVFSETLGLFRGTHCFCCFTRRDRSRNDEGSRLTATLLRADAEGGALSLGGRDVPYLRAIFGARYFLYGQIRKMVAAAKMASDGKLDPGDIQRLLAGGPGERLPSHPPNGLFLESVRFPDGAEKRIERYPVAPRYLRKELWEGTLRMYAFDRMLRSGEKRTGP